MNKAFSTAAVVTFLCATALFAKALPVPDNIRQLITAVAPSIVIVTTERTFEGLQGTHICTGVVVNASMRDVLTAKHCVEEDSKMLPPSVDELPASIVKSDENLILLRVPNLNKPAIQLRKTQVEIGDFSYAFGFGFGVPTVLTRPVAWVDQEDLVVDGLFVVGMSGGPVVDSGGMLIGLIQRSTDRLGFASGLGAIKTFLK